MVAFKKLNAWISLNALRFVWNFRMFGSYPKRTIQTEYHNNANFEITRIANATEQQIGWYLQTWNESHFLEWFKEDHNQKPKSIASDCCLPQMAIQFSVLNIDFRLFISLLHVDTQIPNICSNKEWQIIIVIFVLIECDTFDLSVKPSENIFERE